MKLQSSTQKEVTSILKPSHKLLPYFHKNQYFLVLFINPILKLYTSRPNPNVNYIQECNEYDK
jgi:hypothetical protein